jgi:hypothetical protein
MNHSQELQYNTRSFILSQKEANNYTSSKNGVPLKMYYVFMCLLLKNNTQENRNRKPLSLFLLGRCENNFD